MVILNKLVVVVVVVVLTLVVLLVMLDDIDDISFSKRRYFLIYCVADEHQCLLYPHPGYTYH